MSEIVSYQSAFCVPGDRVNRQITTFGIFDEHGSLVENAEIRTSSWTNAPPKKIRETRSELQIFGPAMFAGSADKQFGFVLLNSLGRLWALDALPPETTIVYTHKTPNRFIVYQYVAMILRSLGIHNPILALRVKTHFETLHVPKEIFGEVKGGCGTSEFYEWIDRKWNCQQVPKKGRKLYVTRSALGQKAGRYACEDHLERLLQEEGYEIYAPEQHPILHQIETFLSAEKLIFAEGSALHLFSLIRQPHQISAVIMRRHNFPQVLTNQMADRTGPATAAIDAIVTIGWPPLHGAHQSRAELNFSTLRDQLVSADFISGHTWKNPSAESISTSMRAGLSSDEKLMTRAEHRAWRRARRGLSD
ncbi:glycosyltransferase 61 family protein [Candidatus Rhodobacter oscarellae]|uniref:glycosyltransferase 61 family protein n=1 Tax=Candidatus Rhodobacter oscarellae TaxID=1675527 RepID=UPI0009E54161|nr:glycosyltransferase 61 family protein [Candidatus Rhodobacter lobularis]